MKKFVIIIMSLLCVLAMSVSVFAASGINANEQRILDRLEKGVIVDGKTVSVSAENLNQATMYMKRDDVDLTKAQADEVIAQIDEAAKIIKDAGVTDLSKMSAATSAAVIECARKAAEVVGLTLSVDTSTGAITIKDSDGNVVAETKPAVKVTGTDMTAIYIAGAALVVIIAGCVVVTRRERLLTK